MGRLLRPAAAVVVVLAAALTPAAADAGAARLRACQWTMWGHDRARTFATACPTRITPETVDRLRLRWFASTHDVVTATPALRRGRLYVGDWSGRVYALSARTGKRHWVFRAPRHPQVYSGQIVASAAVARVGGAETVYVPAGNTMFALRARDGSVRWSYRIGRRVRANSSEIESSPVVVGGRVIFGWDVHNDPGGRPAGVVALDARTGEVRWRHVTAPVRRGPERTGGGCADVWGSPAVDAARRLVLVGTGNCTTDDGWGIASEALLALDLDDGSLRWSFQPHGENQDDLDFAGAPNLFEVDGRPLVGLGNKDGRYYVVDRTTGEQVTAIDATGPGLPRPGRNFSTGGFIGPSAYSAAHGIVVGGTAVGPPPYLHGMDVVDGTIAWQAAEPAATYGATAIAGDLAFVGGTDFTLRAVSVATGATLWSHPMKGAVSGGAILDRNRLYAVAGIREPGTGSRSRTSGVYGFALRGRAARIRFPDPPTSTTTRGAAPVARDCVGDPCDLAFTLKAPPAGTDPHATLEVTEAPFRARIETSGLGAPEQWLRPGSPAAAAGASAFALFASESDDNPTGGLLCVLDDAGTCASRRIPRRGATYTRISLLAVRDPETVPTPADGFERLVTTVSFDPPLAPRR